jgi:hypothetical protein
MAGGFGYFFGGMAQGLESGMSWKQKKLELKEKREAKEELKKLKEQTAKEIKDFSAKLDERIKDGWTEQELQEINVAYLAASKDLQSHFQGVMSYINEGHIAEAQSEMEFIGDFTENLMGSLESLQSKDVAGFYDSIANSITSEQGQKILETHKSMVSEMAKSREAKETQRMEQATNARNQLFNQGTYYNSLEEAQKATQGQKNVDIKFDKDMNAYYAEQIGMTPRDYKEEGVTGSAGTSGVTGTAGGTPTEIDNALNVQVENTGLGSKIKGAWNSLFGNKQTPSVTGTTGNPRAQKANPTDYSLYTEAQLLKMADAGDQEAFKYLYQQKEGQ